MSPPNADPDPVVAQAVHSLRVLGVVATGLGLLMCALIIVMSLTYGRFTAEDLIAVGLPLPGITLLACARALLRYRDWSIIVGLTLSSLIALVCLGALIYRLATWATADHPEPLVYYIVPALLVGVIALAFLQLVTQLLRCIPAVRLRRQQQPENAFEPVISAHPAGDHRGLDQPVTK